MPPQKPTHPPTLPPLSTAPGARHRLTGGGVDLDAAAELAAEIQGQTPPARPAPSRDGVSASPPPSDAASALDALGDDETFGGVVPPVRTDPVDLPPSPAPSAAPPPAAPGDDADDGLAGPQGAPPAGYRALTRIGQFSYEGVEEIEPPAGGDPLSVPAIGSLAARRVRDKAAKSPGGLPLRYDTDNGGFFVPGVQGEGSGVSLIMERINGESRLLENLEDVPAGEDVMLYEMASGEPVGIGRRAKGNQVRIYANEGLADIATANFLTGWNSVKGAAANVAAQVYGLIAEDEGATADDPKSVERGMERFDARARAYAQRMEKEGRKEMMAMNVLPPKFIVKRADGGVGIRLNAKNLTAAGSQMGPWVTVPLVASIGSRNVAKHIFKAGDETADAVAGGFAAGAAAAGAGGAVLTDLDAQIPADVPEPERRIRRGAAFVISAAGTAVIQKFGTPAGLRPTAGGASAEALIEGVQEPFQVFVGGTGAGKDLTPWELGEASAAAFFGAGVSTGSISTGTGLARGAGRVGIKSAQLGMAGARNFVEMLTGVPVRMSGEERTRRYIQLRGRQAQSRAAIEGQSPTEAKAAGKAAQKRETAMLALMETLKTRRGEEDAAGGEMSAEDFYNLLAPKEGDTDLSDPLPPDVAPSWWDWDSLADEVKGTPEMLVKHRDELAAVARGLAIRQNDLDNLPLMLIRDSLVRMKRQVLEEGEVTAAPTAIIAPGGEKQAEAKGNEKQPELPLGEKSAAKPAAAAKPAPETPPKAADSADSSAKSPDASKSAEPPAPAPAPAKPDSSAKPPSASKSQKEKPAAAAKPPKAKPAPAPADEAALDEATAEATRAKDLEKREQRLDGEVERQIMSGGDKAKLEKLQEERLLVAAATTAHRTLSRLLVISAKVGREGTPLSELAKTTTAQEKMKKTLEENGYVVEDGVARATEKSIANLDAARSKVAVTDAALKQATPARPAKSDDAMKRDDDQYAAAEAAGQGETEAEIARLAIEMIGLVEARAKTLPAKEKAKIARAVDTVKFWFFGLRKDDDIAGRDTLKVALSTPEKIGMTSDASNFQTSHRQAVSRVVQGLWMLLNHLGDAGRREELENEIVAAFDETDLKLWGLDAVGMSGAEAVDKGVEPLHADDNDFDVEKAVVTEIIYPGIGKKGAETPYGRYYAKAKWVAGDGEAEPAPAPAASPARKRAEELSARASAALTRMEEAASRKIWTDDDGKPTARPPGDFENALLMGGEQAGASREEIEADVVGRKMTDEEWEMLNDALNASAESGTANYAAEAQAALAQAEELRAAVGEQATIGAVAEKMGLEPAAMISLAKGLGYEVAGTGKAAKISPTDQAETKINDFQEAADEADEELRVFDAGPPVQKPDEPEAAPVDNRETPPEPRETPENADDGETAASDGDEEDGEGEGAADEPPSEEIAAAVGRVLASDWTPRLGADIGSQEESDYTATATGMMGALEDTPQTFLGEHDDPDRNVVFWEEYDRIYDRTGDDTDAFERDTAALAKGALTGYAVGYGGLRVRAKKGSEGRVVDVRWGTDNIGVQEVVEVMVDFGDKSGARAIPRKNFLNLKVLGWPAPETQPPAPGDDGAGEKPSPAKKKKGDAPEAGEGEAEPEPAPEAEPAPEPEPEPEAEPAPAPDAPAATGEMDSDALTARLIEVGQARVEAEGPAERTALEAVERALEKLRPLVMMAANVGEGASLSEVSARFGHAILPKEILKAARDEMYVVKKEGDSHNIFPTEESRKMVADARAALDAAEKELTGKSDLAAPTPAPTPAPAAPAPAPAPTPAPTPSAAVDAAEMDFAAALARHKELLAEEEKNERDEVGEAVSGLVGAYQLLLESLAFKEAADAGNIDTAGRLLYKNYDTGVDHWQKMRDSGSAGRAAKHLLERASDGQYRYEVQGAGLRGRIIETDASREAREKFAADVNMMEQVLARVRTAPALPALPDAGAVPEGQWHRHRRRNVYRIGSALVVVIHHGWESELYGGLTVDGREIAPSISVYSKRFGAGKKEEALAAGEAWARGVAPALRGKEVVFSRGEDDEGAPKFVARTAAGEDLGDFVNPADTTLAGYSEGHKKEWTNALTLGASSVVWDEGEDGKSVFTRNLSHVLLKITPDFLRRVNEGYSNEFVDQYDPKDVENLRANWESSFGEEDGLTPLRFRVVIARGIVAQARGRANFRRLGIEEGREYKDAVVPATTVSRVRNARIHKVDESKGVTIGFSFPRARKRFQAEVPWGAMDKFRIGKREPQELSWDDIRADAEADLTARQEKVRTQWEEKLKEADALQSDSSPPAEAAPAPSPAEAAPASASEVFVWRRPEMGERALGLTVRAVELGAKIFPDYDSEREAPPAAASVEEAKALAAEAEELLAANTPRPPTTGKEGRARIHKPARELWAAVDEYKAAAVKVGSAAAWMRSARETAFRIPAEIMNLEFAAAGRNGALTIYGNSISTMGFGGLGAIQRSLDTVKIKWDGTMAEQEVNFKTRAEQLAWLRNPTFEPPALDSEKAAMRARDYYPASYETRKTAEYLARLPVRPPLPLASFGNVADALGPSLGEHVNERKGIVTKGIVFTEKGDAYVVGGGDANPFSLRYTAMVASRARDANAESAARSWADVEDEDGESEQLRLAVYDIDTGNPGAVVERYRGEDAESDTFASENIDLSFPYPDFLSPTKMHAGAEWKHPAAAGFFESTVTAYGFSRPGEKRRRGRRGVNDSFSGIELTPITFAADAADGADARQVYYIMRMDYARAWHLHNAVGRGGESFAAVVTEGHYTPHLVFWGPGWMFETRAWEGGAVSGEGQAAENPAAQFGAGASMRPGFFPFPSSQSAEFVEKRGSAQPTPTPPPSPTPSPAASEESAPAPNAGEALLEEYKQMEKDARASIQGAKTAVQTGEKKTPPKKKKDDDDEPKVKTLTRLERMKLARERAAALGVKIPVSRAEEILKMAAGQPLRQLFRGGDRVRRLAALVVDGPGRKPDIPPFPVSKEISTAMTMAESDRIADEDIEAIEKVFGGRENVPKPVRDRFDGDGEPIAVLSILDATQPIFEGQERDGEYVDRDAVLRMLAAEARGEPEMTSLDFQRLTLFSANEMAIEEIKPKLAEKKVDMENMSAVRGALADIFDEERSVKVHGADKADKISELLAGAEEGDGEAEEEGEDVPDEDLAFESEGEEDFVDESEAPRPARNAHGEMLGEDTAARRLYDALRTAYEKGEKIRTNKDARLIAGTDADKPSDLNNAAEIAKNALLLDLGVAQTLDWKTAARVTDLLPRQEQDSAQMALQSFSTPPAISALAVQAAMITDNDRAVEPSAGTGNLAVFMGVRRTDVNEFMAPRREGLESLGWENMTAANANARGGRILGQTPDESRAELLGKRMPESYDVVVTNPPFSKNEATGEKGVKVMARFAQSAADMVKDGGRLVVISGENWGPDTHGNFFSALLRERGATVAANIWIDGKLYAKQGASFPIRLTVVDFGEAVGDVVEGKAESLQELADLVGQIRERGKSSARAEAEAEVDAESRAAISAAGRGGMLPTPAEREARVQAKLKDMAEDKGHIVVDGLDEGEDEEEGEAAATPAARSVNVTLPSSTIYEVFVTDGLNSPLFSGGGANDFTAAEKADFLKALEGGKSRGHSVSLDLTPAEARALLEDAEYEADPEVNADTIFNSERERRAYKKKLDTIISRLREALRQADEKPAADAPPKKPAAARPSGDGSGDAPAPRRPQSISSGTPEHSGESRVRKTDADNEPPPAKELSDAELERAKAARANTDDAKVTRVARFANLGHGEHPVALTRTAAMEASRPPPVTAGALQKIADVIGFMKANPKAEYYPSDAQAEMAGRALDAWEKYVLQKRLKSQMKLNAADEGEGVGRKEMSDADRKEAVEFRRALTIGAGAGFGKTLVGVTVMKAARMMGVTAPFLIVTAGEMKTSGKGENPLHSQLRKELSFAGLDEELRGFSGKKNEYAGDNATLFATYGTLSAVEKEGTGRRKPGDMETGEIFTKNLIALDKQLVGDGGSPLDYDGVILVDEFHKAKNVAGKRSEMFGQSEASGIGLMLATLSSRYPNARFVYMSATPFSEPDNLMAAARSLPVGDGEMYGNALDLVNDLRRYGMPLVEWISQGMREDGFADAVDLSFDGVKFESLAIDYDEYQEQIEDAWGRIWGNIREAVYKALIESAKDGLENPDDLKDGMTAKMRQAKNSALGAALLRADNLRAASYIANTVGTVAAEYFVGVVRNKDGSIKTTKDGKPVISKEARRKVNIQTSDIWQPHTERAIVRVENAYWKAGPDGLLEQTTKEEGAQFSRNHSDFPWHMVDMSPTEVILQYLADEFHVSATELVPDNSDRKKMVLQEVGRRYSDQSRTLKEFVRGAKGKWQQAAFYNAKGFEVTPKGEPILTTEDMRAGYTSLEDMMRVIGRKGMDERSGPIEREELIDANLRLLEDGGMEIMRPLGKAHKYRYKAITADPELLAKRAVFEKQVKEELGFGVLRNPLDMVREAFARRQLELAGKWVDFGEISGREMRYDLGEDPTSLPNLENDRMVKATATKQSVLEDFRKDRNAGIIFSPAGGTGVDMQAHPNNVNPFPILHIVFTAGDKADEAIQMLGRSHRANQVGPPTYMLPGMNDPVLNFRLARIATKLRMLGAVSKGDQRGANNQVVEMGAVAEMGPIFDEAVRMVAMQMAAGEFQDEFPMDWKLFFINALRMKTKKDEKEKPPEVKDLIPDGDQFVRGLGSPSEALPEGWGALRMRRYFMDKVLTIQAGIKREMEERGESIGGAPTVRAPQDGYAVVEGSKRIKGGGLLRVVRVASPPSPLDSHTARTFKVRPDADGNVEPLPRYFWNVRGSMRPVVFAPARKVMAEKNNKGEVSHQERAGYEMRRSGKKLGYGEFVTNQQFQDAIASGRFVEIGDSEDDADYWERKWKEESDNLQWSEEVRYFASGRGARKSYPKIPKPQSDGKSGGGIKHVIPGGRKPNPDTGELEDVVWVDKTTGAVEFFGVEIPARTNEERGALEKYIGEFVVGLKSLASAVAEADDPMEYLVKHGESLSVGKGLGLEARYDRDEKLFRIVGSGPAMRKHAPWLSGIPALKPVRRSGGHQFQTTDAEAIRAVLMAKGWGRVKDKASFGVADAFPVAPEPKGLPIWDNTESNGWIAVDDLPVRFAKGTELHRRLAAAQYFPRKNGRASGGWRPELNEGSELGVAVIEYALAAEPILTREWLARRHGGIHLWRRMAEGARAQRVVSDNPSEMRKLTKRLNELAAQMANGEQWGKISLEKWDSAGAVGRARRDPEGRALIRLFTAGRTPEQIAGTLAHEFIHTNIYPAMSDADRGRVKRLAQKWLADEAIYSGVVASLTDAGAAPEQAAAMATAARDGDYSAPETEDAAEEALAYALEKYAVAKEAAREKMTGAGLLQKIWYGIKTMGALVGKWFKGEAAADAVLRTIYQGRGRPGWSRNFGDAPAGERASFGADENPVKERGRLMDEGIKYAEENGAGEGLNAIARKYLEASRKAQKRDDLIADREVEMQARWFAEQGAGERRAKMREKMSAKLNAPDTPRGEPAKLPGHRPVEISLPAKTLAMILENGTVGENVTGDEANATYRLALEKPEYIKRGKGSSARLRLTLEEAEDLLSVTKGESDEDIAPFGDRMLDMWYRKGMEEAVKRIRAALAKAKAE